MTIIKSIAFFNSHELIEQRIARKNTNKDEITK